MVTYHSKKGKFCRKDSAHLVTKDGERYKVVRQHRRMKPKNPGSAKVKKSSRKVARESISRAQGAHARKHVDVIFAAEGQNGALIPVRALLTRG